MVFKLKNGHDFVTEPKGNNSKGAVWFGSTLFEKMTIKSQADDKADDNSCDWRFKG